MSNKRYDVPAYVSCCPRVAYRLTCFVMYSACRIYLHFPVLYLLLRSYRRDVVLAWVLAMALCVSACVCQKSVLYRKGFIEINSKGPLNCLLHVAQIHNTIRKHGLSVYLSVRSSVHLSVPQRAADLLLWPGHIGTDSVTRTTGRLAGTWCGGCKAEST